MIKILGEGRGGKGRGASKSVTVLGLAGLKLIFAFIMFGLA